MSPVSIPPLAVSTRSANLVRMAQAAMLLAACLILVHFSTNLLIPLAAHGGSLEARAQLIYIWLGLTAYPGLRSSVGSQWLLGSLVALPYVLALIGAANMWLFLREARRGDMPSRRAGLLLTRFAALLAVSAIVLFLALPVGWLIASESALTSDGPMPVRITTEHLLMLLFSGALFAVASMFSDAASASEDARSVV